MYDFVGIPVADMREGPSSDSKVVSQALFGECVALGEKRGDWVLIITPDGYSGWAKANAIVSRSHLYSGQVEVSRLSAHLFAVPDVEYGPLMSLPHGSKLPVLEGGDSRWLKVELPDGREAFIQRGDVMAEPFDLISFSKKFLGLPYTWGGRSSFGFDCSGFAQMVYGRLGAKIPRDARDQILDPRAKEVEELELGDLIFWGKSEKEIKHVGIYLGSGEFIHTSSRENKPFLRISALSDFEWSGDPNAYYPFRTARRLSVPSDGKELLRERFFLTDHYSNS